MSDAQIGNLPNYETSTVYTELEKTVLRFADEWTRQGKARPETVQKLTGQLSPAALVTLAATAGLANWTNRFNETFSVELP